MSYAPEPQFDRVDELLSKHPGPILLHLDRRKVASALLFIFGLWLVLGYVAYDDATSPIRLAALIAAFALLAPLAFGAVAALYPQRHYVALDEKGLTIASFFSSQTYPWSRVGGFDHFANPLASPFESQDRRDVGVRFRWRENAEAAGGATRYLNGSYGLRPVDLLRLLVGWRARSLGER